MSPSFREPAGELELLMTRQARMDNEFLKAEGQD